MVQLMGRRPVSRTLAYRPRLESLERRLAPATFTVTNIRDAGLGSFRQSILDTNANPGPDIISFGIGSGVQTIAPKSILPTITGPVNIDGTSQPGADSTPRIVLSGANLATGSALHLTGGNSSIRGLVINAFPDTGIMLFDNGNNVIQGNYIGTDPTGTFAIPNGSGGVLSSQVSNTTVGGTTPGAGNLISGNYHAVNLFEGSGHIVQGNFLGTNAAGTAILGNDSGISAFAVHDSLIGGTVAGACNIISGNRMGIVIAHNSSGNLVQGNYIGTDVTGTEALGNTDVGMLFTSGVGGPYDNTVGGTFPEARNVISGSLVGVYFKGSGNLVHGNYIGTDVTGTVALGNTRGVVIPSSTTNEILGGTAAGAGNLISGNTEYGVEINGGGNYVQGNYIGTNALGTGRLGNGLDGVYVHSFGNTIGGTVPGSRNVISGNGRSGVHIGAVPTGNHVVQGNYIGTDATGTAAIGNRWGVFVTQAAKGNLIGGTSSAARNIISGNNGAGVLLSDITTTDNTVQGNYIGTDVTGAAPLSNAIGVNIFRFSRLNTIGGTASGAGNLISGNHVAGVSITSLGSGGNALLGNRIGTAANGITVLSNGVGVTIGASAIGNRIGGTAAGAGNVIAHSTTDGIRINAGTNNAIRGNAIFDNGGLGIILIDGANNNQPAPVISSVVAGGGNFTIRGTMTASPNATYDLDFFTNTVCDSSGFGEGESYIGTAATTTDSNGVAKFAAMFSASVSSGQFMTATATNPGNNTSEFSACFGVPSPLPPGPEGFRSSMITADPYANVSSVTSRISPLSESTSPPITLATQVLVRDLSGQTQSVSTACDAESVCGSVSWTQDIRPTNELEVASRIWPRNVPRISVDFTHFLVANR